MSSYARQLKQWLATGNTAARKVETESQSQFDADAEEAALEAIQRLLCWGCGSGQSRRIDDWNVSLCSRCEGIGKQWDRMKGLDKQQQVTGEQATGILRPRPSLHGGGNPDRV